MDSLSLTILNRGQASTCVRPQEESIVDITIDFQGVAQLVTGWRVLEDVETLSDHLYIKMVLGTARQSVLRPPRGRGVSTRWALTKLNEEELETALTAVTWARVDEETGRDIPQEVEWLRGIMQQVCDTAMPRTTSLPRRTAYWCTDEITQLRRSSVQARPGKVSAPRARRKPSKTP